MGSLLDPLKAAAAAAFCLVLFWLAHRLTRRLVDGAIAQGHVEERRRLAEEIAARDPAGAVPQASATGDAASSSSSTASIGIVQGVPAKAG